MLICEYNGFAHTYEEIGEDDYVEDVLWCIHCNAAFRCPWCGVEIEGGMFDVGVHISGGWVLGGCCCPCSGVCDCG